MAKKQPATKKPADEKPAAKGGSKQTAAVTVNAIADRVNMDPKAVRARIRRHLDGAQVGKGGRYGWTSWNDPQVKQILSLLEGNKAKKPAAA